MKLNKFQKDALLKPNGVLKVRLKNAFEKTNFFKYENRFYPIFFTNKGGLVYDYTLEIELLLRVLNIPHLKGNDSPRRGLGGNYYHITDKRNVNKLLNLYYDLGAK